VILALGSQEDLHLKRVCEELTERGTPYSVICTKEFPIRDVGTLCFKKGLFDGSYRTDGSRISLNDVSVVWYRRLSPPVLSGSISGQEERGFGMGESRAFLEGLWGVLSNRAWMNPYDRTIVAKAKPYQLRVAQKVGLDIPRTLITNDLDTVQTFFDEAEGAVIYKPLHAYATSALFEDGRVIPSRCSYTNIIDRRTLDKLGEQIKCAPCLFQDYIPKLLELRITVVGDRFLTAAIHSQESDKELSRIDWRRYDIEKTPYSVYDLPMEAKTRLRALLDELGLVYGAIDCILRPDGRIVFLEVNPSGQWMWIQDLTGVPIAGAIADQLTLMMQKGA
jgi:glutathione synthase/RimK-type ligase-like ATP-grasp enzyme